MWRLLASAAAVAIVSLGCKGVSTPSASGPDLDSDPYALLPGSAISAASIDVRGILANPTLGPTLASLAAAAVPFGQDAGFDIKRDLDRIVLGVYSSSGADAAAILQGRFDEVKLAALPASSHGIPLLRGTYAGYTTFTAQSGVFVVLTSKTGVLGSVDAVRRVLERIQDHKTDRALSPWMIETLSTPGAEVAIAVDLATQPVASAAIGALPLPWLNGMRVGKVVANLAPPGMNVAATLSFAEPGQASQAADGVHAAEGLVRVFGPMLGGVTLQNLEARADGNDMKCKFAVDDTTLDHLARILARAAAGAPQ